MLEHAKCYKKLIEKEKISNQFLKKSKQNLKNNLNNKTNNFQTNYKYKTKNLKKFNFSKNNLFRLKKYKKNLKRTNWVSKYNNENEINLTNRIKRNAINYKIENKTKTINDEYQLLTPNFGTPIGSAAKMLTKLLINAKGKSQITQYAFFFF